MDVGRDRGRLQASRPRHEPGAGHVLPRGAPTDVAVGAGAIWVADVEHNQVVRFDARSARAVARIRIRGRLAGVAAGRAGIWALAVPPGLELDPRGPYILTRIDQRLNRVSSPRLRLRCATAFAAGSQAVWVTDACRGVLLKIEPATGRIVRRIRVGRAVWDVELGAGSAWVVDADGGLVRRISPRTARVTATIPADGSVLALGEGAVWVMTAGGRVGLVRQIDPRTNRVVGRPIRLSG